MQLHSIEIQGEYSSAVIYVTDDLSDVIEKLERLSNGVEVSIVDSEGYFEIEVDKLGIYSDPNVTFSLMFNGSGWLVGIYESDYYTEEDVVTLNFVDDNGNEIKMDLCSDTIHDLATEHIGVQGIDYDEEDGWIHRGLIESPVGNWYIGYMEMSEPFIPVMIVLESMVDTIPYQYENLNLFTEEPDSTGNIYYNNEEED